MTLSLIMNYHSQVNLFTSMNPRVMY